MIIDQNNLQASIKEFKIRSNLLRSIINPVLEKYKLEKKESLEVCQIGKFLLNVDPSLQIIDKPKPPSPDFILDSEGMLIGLEHTRIIDSNNSERVFSIKNLFNHAADEFKRTYPNKLICASFRIKDDKLHFKQSDKKELIKKINTYVVDTIDGNISEKPDFIIGMTIQNNSVVSYSFLERNFYGNTLTIEALRGAINKKETKLELYRKDSRNIKEFWLVLMVGSLSSASFEIEEGINYKTDSVFDKVYLMDDFKESVFRIK